MIAYKEGYEAFENGFSESANPYYVLELNTNWDDWQDGWWDAYYDKNSWFI